MRNIDLDHTRQIRFVAERHLIINTQLAIHIYKDACIVLGMPRLGIGPSSFTGHQAAAKVHKKLRCTLPSR